MSKIPFVLVLLLLATVAPAHAAARQLVAPLPNAVALAVGGAVPDRAPAPYEKRAGRAALSRSFMALQQEVRTKDLLEITFFEGEPLLIEVVDFASNRNGTFTLKGRQLGAELATFTMTFGAKTLIMTLADIERRVVYRLVGDLAAGEGNVVEVDQTRLPVRLAVPPPVPGTVAGGEQ